MKVSRPFVWGLLLALLVMVSGGTAGSAPVRLSPSLTLQKTVSTTGTCPGGEVASVRAGTNVTYCYNVTNTGNTPIIGITVNDDGAVLAVGSLGPRQSRIVTRIATVIADSNTAATATGVSPPTKQTVASAPDSASVTIAAPALSLAKTASADGSCPGSSSIAALAGTTATYCYVVTNVGGLAIDGVVVTDTRGTVAVGLLDPGQSASGSVSFIVNDDESTAAVASGTAAGLGSAVVSPPAVATIDVIHPALSIAATVSVDGSCPGSEVVNVLPATMVTVCDVVTNTGDTPVTNVAVTDTQLGAIPGNIPSLTPGQSATLQTTVNAAADKTLLAFATGDVPATGTVVQSPQDPAVIDVVQPSVNIDVTISTGGICPGVDSASVDAGTSIVACYTVTNVGDDTLLMIKIFDQHNALLAQFADLDPGASVSLSGEPTIVDGDLLVSGEVSATDIFGFQVSDGDTAMVHALHAALSLQKTVTDSSCPGSENLFALGGALLTYCYVVTNTGDVPLVNLQVTDGGNVLAIGALAPGQSATASSTFTAFTSEDTAAVASGVTELTNAPVTSGADDASVTVISPALSLQKTVSLDGQCPGSEQVTVIASTNVTFCYSVSNTGDTLISAIVVNDNGRTYSVGQLAPGTSTTIAASVLEVTTDTSLASATGTAPATGTPVTSAQDTATVVVIAPALAISKTVSTDGTCPGSEAVQVLAGTSVTFCYVVTNTGDAQIDGVSVVDDGNSIAAFNLAPGQSITVTRPFVVTVFSSTAAIANGTEPMTGTPVSSAPDDATADVALH